jgi:YebC/PmpR family DNA-binding regulatory protein
MSGHSKWANIKNKKAKVDAARGVNFAKFSREIMIAAKMGGGDPAGNFRLRTAIDKAKAGGLPNDTIKRAVEKAVNSSGSDNYEEITYEGYGPGGVAVFIEAATDNRNRTAGDVRSYFTKFGGNLGESGCVGWMFEPAGTIYFDKTNSYDKIFEDGIEFDIKDVEEEEDGFKVITSVENFQKTVEGYEKLGYKIQESELTRIPQNSVEVTDKGIAKRLLLMLEKLEEHDDVQNVYSNFDMDDSLLED